MRLNKACYTLKRIIPRPLQIRLEMWGHDTLTQEMWGHDPISPEIGIVYPYFRDHVKRIKDSIRAGNVGT